MLPAHPNEKIESTEPTLPMLRMLPTLPGVCTQLLSLPQGPSHNHGWCL